MNRFVICTLLLAAIVAVGFGQLCTPEQFEGYQGSIGGYTYYKQPGVITEHNYIAYDYKNKRATSFITYTNNAYENKFQVLIRYDGGQDDHGKMYIADLRKGTCWIKIMRQPFIRACIPASGKKIHDYTIGPEVGGLKVTGYLIKKGDTTVYMSVVQKGKTIIPVSEVVHGHYGNIAYLQDMGYADIKVGQPNTTMFDIPKQCLEKESESFIPEYLQREHFLLGI